MKKQFDIKKLVLLNLPYLLMGLFTTNFGEASLRTIKHGQKAFLRWRTAALPATVPIWW